MTPILKHVGFADFLDIIYSLKELDKRFLADTAKSLEPGPEHALYLKLIGLYTSKERHYHNLLHLSECFSDFEIAKNLCENPDHVRLALWFHDAIYDTKASGNEEKSAELALAESRLLGIPKPEKVSELVLLTKHNFPPATIDGKIIADIDLAIFAKPWKRFMEYEGGIREEYKHIDIVLFRKKRADILEMFLNRNREERIYYTDLFHEGYNQKAVENLQKSIAMLRA